MSRVRCREHGGWVREEDAVVMGATETGSGVTIPAYACDACVREKGLVPPRRFVGRAYAPPVPPSGFRR